jgi:hypothetical protein
MIQVDLKPGNILIGLVAVILGFTLAHYVGLITWFYFGHDTVKGLVPAFNLDVEGNIPSWFSSILLFSSGLLLGFVASTQKRMGKPVAAWWVLAAIFLFLSVDEFMAIHEALGTNFGEFIGASGLLLEYSWVLLYGPIGVVLLALFIPFLRRLPRRSRNLMILGGIVYVSGAIGVELIGSRFWTVDQQGPQQWEYYVMAGIEETLEMLGLAIFIYSLLVFAVSSGISISATGQSTSGLEGGDVLGSE